jgi:flagellar biogenesis protein FliO
MAIQMLKTLAVLCGVLGLIFALAFVLKKLKLTRNSGENGTPGWRVAGVRMLAPRKHVYILEVGTKLLLVGTTDKTMSALMEVSDPAEREMILSAISHKRVLSSFKDFLHRAES